jgi:hypothetical protein
VTLYQISIEGEMEIFSEHDEGTIKKLQIELQQFMECEFKEFLSKHWPGQFRASGKMERLFITKE